MNRGLKYFQKLLLSGNINGDIYLPACFCQHAYQCVNGKIHTLLQEFLVHKVKLGTDFHRFPQIFRAKVVGTPQGYDWSSYKSNTSKK